MTIGRWFLLKQVDRVELVIKQQTHLSPTENQGTYLALSWGDIWKGLIRKKGSGGSRGEGNTCAIAPVKWIRKRFNVETGQLWASILLFHCADERSAVERFFSLFEEFLNRGENCQDAYKQVKSGSVSP